MKIELTDKEIKTAVANYVSDTLGLDLVHNDLAIAFSATRHEGLIAKLETTPKAEVLGGNFDEPFVAKQAAPVIPGYSDDTPEPKADPAEPEVAAAAQAEATLGDPVQEAATLVPTADTAPVEIPAPEADAPVEETTSVAETEAPKKTATLFGKPASAAA